MTCKKIWPFDGVCNHSMYSSIRRAYYNIQLQHKKHGVENLRCYSPENILIKRFWATAKIFYPGFIFFEQWICPAGASFALCRYTFRVKKSRVHTSKNLRAQPAPDPLAIHILCPNVPIMCCTHTQYVLCCTRFGDKGALSRRRSHNLSSYAYVVYEGKKIQLHRRHEGRAGSEFDPNPTYFTLGYVHNRYRPTPTSRG